MDSEDETRQSVCATEPIDVKKPGFNKTNSLRARFANGEVAHLRSSVNTPELRLYTEADSPERAQELLTLHIGRIAEWLAGST